MIKNHYLLKVETLDSLEHLRVIRNECREYMTRHNKEIDEEQQKQWFSSIDREKIIPFLFMNNHDPIGYGLIVHEFTKFYLSAGLSKKYRGFGLGKIIFNLLIDECKKINHSKSIELEVLKTNLRAFNLYKKLGFEIISEDQNKYEMKLY